MSGKDLQATFLNMYKNRELETSGNYFLSLCDGTKKIKVKSVSIYALNEKNNANQYQYFPLKFDTTESEEYGLALYNHETISPDGSTSTYGYVRFYPSVTLGTYNGSAIMQLTKSKRGDVVTESYVYVDLKGRVLQECDEYGVTTTYEYHTDGSLKKQTIKSGDQNMVVYENTQKTSNDGQYDILMDKSFNLGEKYTYHNLFGTLDKVERLCYNESTETVYNTTNYGYDSYYEQLLSVSSTADNQTHTNTLTYEDGVLSTVTDGKVNYKFTYDKATDTATFNVEDGSDWKKLEEVERDKESNTVTHKYYREDDEVTDTFVYAYDKYGKPTVISYNGEQKVTYNYTEGSESEGAQSINEIVDGYNDQTVNYTYDDDNSVKKVSIKQTSTEATLLETEKLSADAVNYTFNSSNTDVYTVQIVYDSEKTIGQQVKETKVLSANNIKYAYISKEYTYDDFGRLASSKYYNASSNDPATNSITDARTSYKYRNNAPNQFEEVNYAYSFTSHYPAGWFVHTSSKDTTFRYHDILYDERGNVTQLKESCEIKEKDILETEESVVSTYTVTSTYGYDNFNRLTSETNEKLGLTASYEYDVNNRLHKATRNGVEKTYYYDGRGRLALVCTDGVELGESYRYDNYGNRTSYSKTIYQDTAYVWTRGNLLAEIDKTDKIIRYKYDHTGIRTEKAIGAITTTYYWNSGKLIGEDRVGTDGATNKLRYFYDLKGICGFSYDGTTYSYIKDIFGNVTALMVGVGLIARYSYDAWGNHKVYNPDGTENTSLTFIGNINPIRYRGYYYDSESGLYYLMSRYYDPEIGQFISMDTPDYLAPDIIGGVDLYAYCGYNPVMYVDPSGHIMITASLLITAGLIGLGVGAVVGAAYGAATAYINGQDVFGGTVIGALGGAFMGLGAGIASVFIAPVLGGTGLAFATAQGVGFFMGTAISGGTAIAIGASIAFTSGAIGGAFVDIATQIVNNGAVTDVGSIFVSALQWGTVNTVNVFLGSLIEAISFIDIGIGFSVVSAIINSIFMNLITGAIGMIIDIERVKKGN